MKLLFQEQMNCSVRRMSSDTVQAEVMRLSTREETVARILVSADRFRIEQAEWESYRQKTEYRTVNNPVPDLFGAEAYFGIAPALARAFPAEEQQPLRALFAECVKGVIQSETYLYPQRGYADSTAYQKKWDKTHPGTCLYYSNLDKVDRRWFDYVGDDMRTGHLFQRTKSVIVWRSETGNLSVTGSFLDSFHELGMVIECLADGTITASSGTFLRAPGRICFENGCKAGSIIGKTLKEMGKATIGKKFGGACGCAHMVDIAYEMIAATIREMRRV